MKHSWNIYSSLTFKLTLSARKKVSTQRENHVTTEWKFKLTLLTNQEISDVPFLPLIGLYKFIDWKVPDVRILKKCFKKLGG